MPPINDDNTRLVYSSDSGRVPERAARGDDATRPPAPRADGIVRVSHTSSGRRGKTVTLISGLPAGDLVAVAKELKRVCGSGGAVKDGVVEIQGDHRARVIAQIESRYRVKAAGG